MRGEETRTSWRGAGTLDIGFQADTFATMVSAEKAHRICR